MNLGDALFSATQQAVLGLLYGKPDRSFYTNEILRAAALGRGTVSRELERLVSAGVLTATRQGNQVHYQANPACPIHAELLGIVRKTFGIAEPLRHALQPFASRIAWAFVYGSLARDEAHAGSDIDLMLIGNALDYHEVVQQLLPLESGLGRPINPTIYTREEWLTRYREKAAFVSRVLAQPRIDVLGQDPVDE